MLEIVQDYLDKMDKKSDIEDLSINEIKTITKAMGLINNHIHGLTITEDQVKALNI